MRDCMRAANFRSSSVTYVTIPMTALSTMNAAIACCTSGGSVTYPPGGPEMAPRPPTLGRAPAQPWRASGSAEVASSIHFPEHRIDGAHDRDDVGDLGADQDVRQDREV